MNSFILFALICALTNPVHADDITGPEPDEIETTTEAETTTESETTTETETDPPADTNEDPTDGPEEETEEETEPVTVQPREGWIQEGDSFYYYMDDTAVTGWQQIDGSWFYFFASGEMATGWQQINGSWYYLAGSGRMATGWIKIDGKWYYLYESGRMATGWLKENDRWYYLYGSGRMATGWLKLEGKWYYLKKSGAMAVGWLKIDNVWYYFSKNGSMADRSLKIAICGTYGSESYQVDDDLWAVLEDLGAVVTKVGPSVNPADYDGLVVPGGLDIDPSMYGEGDYGCYSTDIAFDRHQYAVLDKFVKAGKPVLGVCRGCEFINVYFGGSLYQDIGGHNSWHKVTSSSGSRLAAACGSGFSVCSSHHQALKRLGDGLKVTQRAPDNVIEAVEHVSLPVVGVLWHPEWTGSKGKALLRYFLYSMCTSSTTGWHKIKGEWYYFDPAFVRVTGWQMIDGQYYYFKSSGAMAAHEWVAGYWWLSSNGVWDYKYKGFWKKDSTGWKFGDSSGWYAHDETITINGKKYTFDSGGYMK